MSEHETGECGGQDNCFECRGIELAALRSRSENAEAKLGEYLERACNAQRREIEAVRRAEALEKERDEARGQLEAAKSERHIIEDPRPCWCEYMDPATAPRPDNPVAGLILGNLCVWCAHKKADSSVAALQERLVASEKRGNTYRDKYADTEHGRMTAVRDLAAAQERERLLMQSLEAWEKKNFRSDGEAVMIMREIITRAALASSKPAAGQEYAVCDRCYEETPVAPAAQRACPRCLAPRRFVTKPAAEPCCNQNLHDPDLHTKGCPAAEKPGQEENR